VIDAKSFMEDIEFTMRWREKLTYEALKRGDWRILMTCESTPDRVQHMMYQYYDAQHPLHDANASAQKMTFCGKEIALSDAIPASYRELDRIVGKVLDDYVKAGDTLLVCSDHGFQSFRRQVHLNNWLIEKGYLAIRADATKDATSTLNSYVDWSRTRAYAVGLGMLYVNMRGREGQGIVEPAAARSLMDEIRREFMASTDPQTGERFGHEAYVLSEIHKDGPFQDREADMLLCFNPGYRVSWDTTLGGFRPATGPAGELIAAESCSDNTKNWSGDHVTVDPSFVAGIFASNRKIKAPEGGFNLLHIAPTALALVGVPVPKEYDLPPLQFE
jgi:predicted AlkP superfamily phosphohydrolase/phosphomutase